MEKINFEVVHYSWYKRRTRTETINKIVSFEVEGFDFVEDKECIVRVVYGDGLSCDVIAKIHANKTYALGNVTYIHGWWILGTTECGRLISLKMV